MRAPLGVPISRGHPPSDSVESSAAASLAAAGAAAGSRKVVVPWGAVVLLGLAADESRNVVVPCAAARPTDSESARPRAAITRRAGMPIRRAATSPRYMGIDPPALEIVVIRTQDLESRSLRRRSSGRERDYRAPTLRWRRGPDPAVLDARPASVLDQR